MMGEENWEFEEIKCGGGHVMRRDLYRKNPEGFRISRFDDESGGYMYNVWSHAQGCLIGVHTTLNGALTTCRTER